MMKKGYIGAVILAATTAVLIIFSKDAKAGALDGYELCENVIVPSLLPILVLTNTIASSKGAELFEKFFGNAVEKIFSLPKCCSTAILFGMAGGYPAGAIMTKSLLEENRISKSDAKRLMSFNICGGCAFIITAVGTICRGSQKLGIILYLSCVLSSMIIGTVEGLFSEMLISQKADEQQRLPLGEALPSSVEKSIKAILTMGVYIVLFSAVTKIFDIPGWAAPLVEITNGVCGRQIIPAEYCSFFLSFGGLCIHFQIMGIMSGAKISYISFFIHRVASGVLSFCITKIFLLIFPDIQNVFSTSSEVTSKMSMVNSGMSVVLILGCAVLILDIQNKKSKLI